MQWLFPAGAWAFLALAVITALYLLRRRSESVTVPSLLLWQRAQAEQQAMRPFQKLKKNVLYFLQLALAVLLALALMRPAISGGVQGETVFIFDLSASMQAVSGGESRLEEARRRAAALVDGMGTGDRVTVLAAGLQTRTLLSRSGDLGRVQAVLNALEAENGGADIDSAVSLAQAMGRDIEGLNIVVFSDTYAGEGVQTVRVGRGADNRALLSLSLSADGQAFVRVANYGGPAAVTLECVSDGALTDVALVDLAEDETRAVLLQAAPEAQTVTVSIQEADTLAADNTRWYARQGADSYRTALCAENVFLEKAVALRPDITLLRTTAEEAAALENIDLYIFDGALPETLPAAGALLCVAPDREVLGITPGEAAAAAGTLRAAPGDLARRLTENLSLSETALRSYTPLSGGVPLLTWNGGALAAAREDGSRRIAVLGFDLHDSNLPMQGDFPILIQNLLSWLLPDTRQAFAESVCGQAIPLPYDARAERTEVTLPSGRRIIPGAVLEETDDQGVYALTYTYADGTARTARFALHMDGAESDVRQVGPVAGPAVLGGSAAAGTELTPWVLLAFLILLLVEWEVSRRVA